MLGRALPLRNDSGEIVKWFGTCTDIEQLKVALGEAAELRGELERRPTHDSLTGLGNRDLLFLEMERMFAQGCRSGVAARIGGDEFVVIGEAHGPEDAERLAQRVLGAVRGRLLLEGEQVEVAASVGVRFVGPAESPSADVVLAQADARMYEAKRRRSPMTTPGKAAGPSLT